jgi:hypothetical protein
MSKTTRLTGPRSPIHRNSDALVSLTIPRSLSPRRDFGLRYIANPDVYGFGTFLSPNSQTSMPPVLSPIPVAPRSFSCRDIAFRDIAIPDAMFSLSSGLPNYRTPTPLGFLTRVPSEWMDQIDPRVSQNTKTQVTYLRESRWSKCRWTSDLVHVSRLMNGSS